METTFTPGPWHVRRDPLHFDSATCVVAGISGNRKPFMYTLEASIGGDTDLETMEANAQLIAAAPELYAVLSELEESCEYWSEYEVPLGIAERIKSALQKARGEQ